MFDSANNLPAARLDDLGDIRLKRLTKSIVGRHEEPVFAAAVYNSPAGYVGERICVVGPVNKRRRALRAGQNGACSPGDDQRLAALLCNLVNGQGYRRVGDIHDEVNAIDLIPAAGNVGTDVGLVLVVCKNKLYRLSSNLVVQFFKRHFCRLYRTGPRYIGVQAGHVRQNTNLDFVVTELRMGGRDAH